MSNPISVKQRKMLYVLPLIILPFLFLLFWSLGGGRSADSETIPPEINNILKSDLPGANLKDDAKMDKMSYYKQADHDSSKWRDQLKQDPYAREDLRFPGSFAADSNEPLSFEKSGGIESFSPGSSIDPTEQEVYAKLQQLQSALKEPTAEPGRSNSYPKENHSSAIEESQVNRLAALVDQVHGHADTGSDPEIKELNGMLDKIMAIQHPERLPNSPKPTTVKEAIISSPGQKSAITISRLDTVSPVGSQRFFTVSNRVTQDTSKPGLLAVVHDNQQVVNGARIKLRITQAFEINGESVPKDQFIYATVQLSSDCLQFTLAPLQFNGRIYPIGLSVYDINGLPCIPVQGTITGDAARQSASQTLQGLGGNSFDPSIAAQAASTGLQAAKTLLNRRVKLVKVLISAGHPLLLIPKLH